MSPLPLEALSANDLGRQVRALKHDIERHIAITSEQAMEIERLREEIVQLNATLSVAVAASQAWKERAEKLGWVMQ